MKTNVFTKSPNMTQEYCCTVVKLGEIQEIPNAKTVAKTLVNGRTIVISKDRKEGDVMIYCSNESQLNFDFLSVNNLFQHTNLNCNADEVEQWKQEHLDATEDEVKEYLRQHRGYFDDKGRVKMKKLAGEVSMGVLFELETLKKWCPNLDVNLEEYVGLDFDTVNGELFIQPYIPKIKTREHSKGNKRNKKLLKYDRLIPGQFEFHYDTQQFERNMHRFTPDNVVTISNKIHGTSYIIANVLVNKPKYKGLYEKLFLYLPKFLRFTKQEYDVIYSSRSVVKNQFINNGKVGYSAGLDACFNKYYELLKDYIPQNYSIYGEIFGYCEDSNSFIQKVGKGYDYKCKPGENKFMPYRITVRNEDGKKNELSVQEVQEFTFKLINQLTNEGKTDVAKRIYPIDILYYGSLKDLYPDIDTEQHWRENFLERIKNDKDKFGMELNEPLCRNTVPREGIVIRIENDVIPEAFKLKCLKFLGKESEEIDRGAYEDAEMLEHYTEEQ